MKLETRVRSILIRGLSSKALQSMRRFRPRLARRLKGGRPVVHYFHELTDPFSQLAAQRLEVFVERYDVELRCHLVSGEADDYRGDAGRFDAWALTDARAIAGGFGVEPPGTSREGAVALARGVAPLAPLVTDADLDDPATFADGNALRQRLGHYLGAMFHFEGEWFWGLDRLDLLEQRLIREGFSREPDAPLVAPRPTLSIPQGVNAGNVLLEYFPSLRSPYTAVGHGEVEAVIDGTGVQLQVRPVMPMLMRGIPAPRRKQFYIPADAAREARARGITYGRIVDPFGAPVTRAFSLWHWIRSRGRELEFVRCYLRAAWAEGVDVGSQRGLDRVLRAAGLDPLEALDHYDDPESRVILEDNLQAMFAAGLWGVPSFRVSGGATDAPAFACWGQDRIWRVAAEIVERAGASRS